MVTKTCNVPVQLFSFLSVFSLLHVIEPNPWSPKEPWTVPPCQRGWKLTPEPHTCVSNLGLSEKLTWKEAREICRKHDADLMTISNMETNSFIWQYTSDQMYTSVWLSLTDQEADGEWVWDMGAYTRTAYSAFWAPRHPVSSTVKNCAIQKKFDQGWKSVSCSEKHAVICETQSIIDTHKICKSGIKIEWIDSVKCVLLLKDKMTWSAAKVKCMDLGGSLLTIFAIQVARFIDGYATKAARRWIGLHRNEEDDKWVWANGLKTSFRNWKHGKPENNETCAYYSPDGKWIDMSCEKTFFPLCQKPVRDFTAAYCSRLRLSDKSNSKFCKKPGEVQPCPEGWEVTPEPRSCVSDLGLTKMWSWQMARRECYSYNADLVNIPNQRFNKFIQGFIKGHEFSDAIVWISLTDEEEEGKWRWHLGHGLTQEATYTNWAPGQPVRSREKNCVTQRSFADGWKVVSCKENHTVICEPKGGNSKGRIPTSFTHANKLKWLDARVLCDSLSSRLLTLSDEKKARAADKLPSGLQKRWVGMRYSSRDMRWMWTNGLTVNDTGFESWFFARPSGREINRCATIDPSGTWQRSSCRYLTHFLCQKVARTEARDAQLKIKYHRPGPAVVRDQLLEMTCTAINTRGPLVWHIFKRDSQQEFVPPVNATTKYEVVEDTDGVCVTRTISRLVINASILLKGAQISCSTVPKNKRVKCRRFTVADTSCCVSPPLKLWEKPIARPQVTLSFPDGVRYDGTIKEDSMVFADCQTVVKEAGDITWVMFYPTGPKIIANNDWNHMLSYQKFQNRTSVAKKYVVRSRLRLRMHRYLSGTTIACFSYDLGGPESNLACDRANLFCQKSPELVADSGFEDPRIGALDLNKEEDRHKLIKAILTMVGIALMLVALFAVGNDSAPQCNGQDTRENDLWDSPSPDDSVKKEKITDV